MSDQDKLTPGKSSPGALTHGIDKLRAPGKGTLVSGAAAASSYAPACDRDPALDGCELLPEQRRWLLDQARGRIRDAADQYRDALRVVQVKEMIKKDDDLPWAAGLLLDLIGLHVGKAIGGAVKRLQAGGVARLERAALEAGISGVFRDSPSVAETLLHAMSPERIDGNLKIATDLSKKLASSRMKALVGDQSSRQGKIDYLEQLQDESWLGWVALREQAPAIATDVELVAMIDAFAPEHHRSSIYQKEILSKMARLTGLHLERVGRNAAFDGGDDTARGFRGNGPYPITRDVRLVWVVYSSGRPRQLAFQHQDRAQAQGFEALGVDGTPRRPAFGEDSRDRGGSQPFGSPLLGRSPSDMDMHVPAEFYDAALAQHRAVWGTDPTEYALDDTRTAGAIGRISLGPTPVPPVQAKPAPAAPKPTLPADFDLTKALRGTTPKGPTS